MQEEVDGSSPSGGGVGGVCNSCTAHAAVAAIDACLWIARDDPGGDPIESSVQQLVDCTNGRNTGRPGKEEDPFR